jgi:hypothetical protein
MRILIAVGMIIIFVSAFFIFLAGDAMFRNAFDCTSEAGREICVFKGLTGPPAFGVFIVAFFIMIDILTVYLMVSNLK